MWPLDQYELETSVVLTTISVTFFIRKEFGKELAEEDICALYLMRTYQLMDKCHFFKRQNIFSVFPFFFVIAKIVTLRIFYLFVTEENLLLCF